MSTRSMMHTKVIVRSSIDKRNPKRISILDIVFIRTRNAAAHELGMFSGIH